MKKERKGKKERARKKDTNFSTLFLPLIDNRAYVAETIAKIGNDPNSTITDKKNAIDAICRSLKRYEENDDDLNGMLVSFLLGRERERERERENKERIREIKTNKKNKKIEHTNEEN
jgi:hypothetical protein